MFLDKTCTISTTSYTSVGGTAKRTYTALYTNIPCNFEQNKKKLYNAQRADNADAPEYVVILPIAYNQVRENYIITLTDPTLGNMGEYIISSVNADKSATGMIDCITLFVSSMKGQL